MTIMCIDNSLRILRSTKICDCSKVYSASTSKETEIPAAELRGVSTVAGNTDKQALSLTSRCGLCLYPKPGQFLYENTSPDLIKCGTPVYQTEICQGAYRLPTLY